MKIAVLGTGMVGKTIAHKLASLGHDVALGTREPAATLAKTEPGAFGDPPVAAWLESAPGVAVATFADAVRDAALVFVATKGDATLAVLEGAGAALDGKIVVDISNPLDFSRGMPPRLFVSNDDSLGEQAQRAFPKAKIVKTLNIVSAPVMVAPSLLGEAQPTMFVSGNDADAKRQVTQVLTEWLGWEQVIDLGDITTARGTEMLLPLWVRAFGALGTPMFGFRLVR